MDRYFAAMGAEDDFSVFFAADVTWRMVDSGQLVRGASAVRDHILELHGRMHAADQRPMVVADGIAVLEGHAVNPGGTGPGWRTASSTTRAGTRSRLCGATERSLC